MKQELLGSDVKACPAEENVEAICHFFNTIGKQLDESPKSRRINDMYFGLLKELTTNPQLAPRLRFMVRDVLDLRANNWVPRREEVCGGSVCFFLSFSPLRCNSSKRDTKWNGISTLLFFRLKPKPSPKYIRKLKRILDYAPVLLQASEIAVD